MKANKTWWTEKWLVGGATQTVRVRVLENSNYDEYTVMYLKPIEDIHTVITLPKELRNSTGGVGILVED